MTVTSNKDMIYGQPAIHGHRLSVAHAVANINDIGLEEYLDNFDLANDKDKQFVKDAIVYCMNEACDNGAVSYCQGCHKNQQRPGDKLWETARYIFNTFYSCRSL